MKLLIKGSLALCILLSVGMLSVGCNKTSENATDKTPKTDVSSNVDINSLNLESVRTPMGQVIDGNEKKIVYKALVEYLKSVHDSRTDKYIYAIDILGHDVVDGRYNIYAWTLNLTYKNVYGKITMESGLSMPVKVSVKLSPKGYSDLRFAVPSDEHYSEEVKEMAATNPVLAKKLSERQGNVSDLEKESREIAKKLIK